MGGKNQRLPEAEGQLACAFGCGKPRTTSQTRCKVKATHRPHWWLTPSLTPVTGGSMPSSVLHRHTVDIHTGRQSTNILIHTK